RDYLVQSIQPKLQNLPGVGAIWLYGASTYAMRIWLDPQKMAALGVTGTDIQSVLQSNNIDFSGGSIQGHNRNFSLVASTRLNTAKEFQNLIVRDDNGNVVKLGDVAKVELGSQSLEDSPMRINGKNAVDMEIRPLVSANPITVAKEVKAVLKQIQKDLPKDMTMQVTWDQSLFLHAAINESFMTLFEAIFLVVLVVILFLGSIRAAIVPIVTIPVCVVGVFGVMLLFSFSLNVMTLLAIILAIGLVVDDAIVMLENIHRHIETGETPMQAAIRGSREIGFAVIAMTLTLAAVYAPTGFATGFSAGVFKEFAFSLAGAVLISGFVALTLSPMMCSRILMPKQEENPYQKCLTRYFEGLNRGYQALLGKLMNYRWWVVASLMVIAGLGYFVYQSVPQAFIPKEDLGYFTADISGPSGSNIDYTNRYMQSLDQIYADTPDILSYASFIDAGSGVNFVTLKPFTERKLTTEQVLSQIFPKLNGIPGITVTPQIPDPVQYTEDST
ncbi:MAG: efflux RND transporter permease subunit, partial [Gammaproteobacteria bacterium]|nr:efflux RND transporter permease subunit [Gammaproteobacteria bacterium]